MKYQTQIWNTKAHARTAIPRGYLSLACEWDVSDEQAYKAWLRIPNNFKPVDNTCTRVSQDLKFANPAFSGSRLDRNCSGHVHLCSQ